MKVTEQQIRSEELKSAFLRHLPQRVRILLRRAERQHREGWDVNTLHLLEGELARLADAAGRYGMPEQAAPLQALAETLQAYLPGTQLPDAAANDAIGQALDALRAPIGAVAVGALGSGPAAEPTRPDTDTDAGLGFDRATRPPPAYWLELGIADLEPQPQATAADAAPPDTMASVLLPAAEETSVIESASATPTQNQDPPIPTATITDPAPAATDSAATATVLILGHDPLLHDCALQLEHNGHTVAQVERVEAAIAALQSPHPPRLLLLAPRLRIALPLLAPALRQARLQDGGQRIALLALLEQDELGARLEALRNGADHAPARTQGLPALLAQVEPLLQDGAGEAPYRVLIVDDDAAQAAFAEVVLRKAGMQTRTVVEPLATLDELERFQPDLILMDINMPGADGLELTALIREREAFVATPIVFLSGDPDADRQYAALDAGGDDFIAKPVRPRHLIAAVGNRIRRARATQQRMTTAPRSAIEATLVERSVLFDRIARQLAAHAGAPASGGLLLIEINEVPRLRERLGLAGFDLLQQQLAAWIAAQALPRESLAPFGPSAVLLFSPRRDADALAALAEDLGSRIGQERFEAAHAQPLALSAGTCGMDAGADPLALLGVCERNLDAARRSGRVVLRRQAADTTPALAAELRRAIADDTLHLVFQPLVPIGGDIVTPRYQALLRLRSSGGSELTATQLLPEARTAGLLPALDVRVLLRALAVLTARARLGLPLALIVSQSWEAAAEVWRDETLRAALTATTLPPAALVLEYRCEALRGQYGDAARHFDALRAAGLGTALAGVNAQTLAEPGFETLPLDYVKLAPEMARDGQARAVTAAAHMHGARVIAPRVQDAGTAAAFYAAGADLLQGNFVQAAGQQLDYDFTTHPA